MRNFNDEKLLLIDPDPGTMVQKIKEWTTEYNVSIYVAKTGFEGLVKYKEYEPELILISCKLTDINGMSLSTIIKDGQYGRNVSIFLYDIEGNILGNTKADFFCTMTDKNLLYETLCGQIVNFYEHQRLTRNNSMEIMRARNEQFEKLPTAIDNEYYTTTNIFSAFSVLSGDSFDYWMDAEKNLYGILIDCWGHEVRSFSQVNTLMAFIKKELRMIEFGVTNTLEDVFVSVNEDLYSLNSSPDPVAGIIFKVDIDKGLFTFTTAGIPGIYIKRLNNPKLEIYECENFLLGFDKSIKEFDTFTIPLFDVESIVICSDGLWEVAFSEEEIIERGKAKHDDVSGIIINFKDAFHKTYGDNVIPFSELKKQEQG